MHQRNVRKRIFRCNQIFSFSLSIFFRETFFSKFFFEYYAVFLQLSPCARNLLLVPINRFTFNSSLNYCAFRFRCTFVWVWVILFPHHTLIYFSPTFFFPLFILLRLIRRSLISYRSHDDGGRISFSVSIN